MLYQTIPQLVARQSEHGPWARNFVFIKFLTLTHSSSPIGPYTVLPLLIASPSGWCAPADHAANVDVRKGIVASDPELVAVRMPLQDIRDLIRREAGLNNIRCTASEVHRFRDTTNSMIVRGVPIPTVNAHRHRPNRRSQIAQNATKQNRVGDQVRWWCPKLMGFVKCCCGGLSPHIADF